MTKHAVGQYTPPLIDDERFNRNGMVPNSAALRRLAEGFNYVACRQKKQILARCQLLSAVTGSDASVQHPWPFFFHTGENTTGLTLHLGQVLLDTGFGSSYAKVTIRDHATGSVADSKELDFYGLAPSTAVAPGEVHHGIYYLTGLTPNTDYYGQFFMFLGSRILYASVSETSCGLADDSVTAVCDPGPLLAEGPIYSTHGLDLVDANNKLWRHNGAHLSSWSTEKEESPVAVSSTTYTNVIDGTTAVAASSIGFDLWTQYHNTANRTTVPCKLAVNALRTAGAGTLDVRYTDGTNSIALTGIGTGGIGSWYVTTGTVPPQAGTKWDIQAKVSAGGTTFDLYAASLFEYEA
jgi:hypothetical protein